MPIHLHLIAFNVPYPADNGGVIDVFYKLKALHASGIKVHLHCFLYNRPPAPELEQYCEEIHYYQRNMSWKAALHIHPFIVIGRRNKELLQRLQQDNHPILLDGIHSGGLLLKKSLRNRQILYRAGNVEHEYYAELASNEKYSLFRKIYYHSEAWKLRLFESKLSHASAILAISDMDTDHFEETFPQVPTYYIPAFHPYDTPVCRLGSGTYALYHGNLYIPENYKAADFLISEVFSKLPEFQFKIAGANPPLHLIEKIKHHGNIELICNPSDKEIQQLIQNAHVNVLPTFQQTGLKLKLLYALFSGRFCLVNNNMLFGSGLGEVCHVANTSEQMELMLRRLFQKEFTKKELQQRTQVLKYRYDNSTNAKKIIDILK